jgi:hypothetical protein
MITVSPETLDAVWQKWRCEHSKPNDVWPRSYIKVTRNYGPGKQFEEWLFTECAMVKQINRKRHLQFIDEERATFFLLRNT